MRKTLMLFLFIFIFAFAISLNAQEHKIGKSHATVKDLKCSDCHNCPNPTIKNPCLVPCPRPFNQKGIGKKITVDKTPAIINIDEMENLYEPVKFSHKKHADMAKMGDGCTMCHHYTPTDKSHPPCKQCHSQDALREDMNKPGLKGAYHQQCMSCHIDWSNDTACEVCHALKDKSKYGKQGLKPPVLRPSIEPEKNIYETDFDEGQYVTFFHKNHSNMYGLECSDCHVQQPCSECHYQGQKEKADEDLSVEEKHEKCSKCHDTDDENECSKCHSDEKRTGFDHGKATGWALNIYHKKLPCRNCHPANKPIGKLSSSCNSCHKNWDAESFDHSVVGLKLDETHLELECSDCHPKRRFDKKPSCVDCHEDEFSYPDDKPGTPTQKGKK